MPTYDIVIIQKRDQDVNPLSNKCYLAVCLTPVPCIDPQFGSVHMSTLPYAYGSSAEEAREALCTVIRDHLCYMHRHVKSVSYEQVQLG